MSGLFSGLKQAATALDIHAKQATIAGNNIANLNNDKYARQYAIISTAGSTLAGSGVESLGIEISTIQNVRNVILDNQIVKEGMVQGSLKSQQIFSASIETAIGEKIDRSQTTSSISTTSDNGSTGGIAQGIDDFFNAFKGLSATPTDSSQKVVLVKKASALVSKLNLVSSRLATVDASAVETINGDVNKVNDLLGKIATFNTAISRLEVGKPGSALEVRDELQGVYEELAQYVNFNVKPIDSSPGNVQVVIQDTSGNDIVLVNKGVVDNALNYNGTSFVASGTSSATLDVKSGSLGGVQSVRTGVLAQTQTQLNALTSQIVGSVNTAYNPTSATGQDFFLSTGTTAATIALDPNLTVTSLKTTNTSAASANELAIAVAGLVDQTFSTGSGASINGTFTDYFNQINTGVAKEVTSAKSALSGSDLALQSYKKQRATIGGVSLDEEVTNLMRYQKAYQASARVMSVISQLMDELVGLVR